MRLKWRSAAAAVMPHSMRSKMVTDRLKAHDSVAEALRQLSAKVGTQAEGLCAPHLKKGEKMPDLALFAELLGRMLEDRAKAMDAADSEHAKELSDDNEPRAERDEAAEDLYSSVMEVKAAVETMFGVAWAQKLGLAGGLPRDAATLSRATGDLLATLRTAKLPKPKLLGIARWDVDPWVAKLDAQRKRLEKALKEVTREAREAQATLVEKNRAVDAYDTAFAGSVACAVGLLRLVGEHEHAARLRPSDRRPGTLASDEPTSQEPEPEPATPEPPA